jgi:hypothetical protein
MQTRVPCFVAQALVSAGFALASVETTTGHDEGARGGSCRITSRDV